MKVGVFATFMSPLATPKMIRDFGQRAKVFDTLAEGGTVAMPFSDTFWAKKFGMVKDRFGCHWIVNGEMIDMHLAV